MRRKLLLGLPLAVFLALLFASPASAQDANATQIVLDNIWVMIAGALVFLMQAGFALVEAGLTRAKNVSNIMAKNISDAAVGAICFFAVGYSVAFASGDTWWGGLGDVFMNDSADPGSLNLPGASGVGNLTPATFFFFQVVFAATAVTIASGAMAERTKFKSYLIFSAVMTAVIYPVVVHWTWGGGLVAKMKIGEAVYSDFAGSTVVHMTGGVAAFMGAAFLGPRIGRYSENGTGHPIPGHSIPMAVLGVLLLWFGWFGFNAGSELAADNLVPMLAMNTFLAAAAGAFGAAIMIWWKSGVPDVAMVGNGILAGLVAVTAPVGAVEPWAAIVIGFVGGVIVVSAVLFFDRIRIDDPVGAVSVHGVCGVWGTLSVGLFARYDDAFLGRENAGLFYGGGFDQLIVQFLFVLVVAVWVAATTAALFWALKRTMGLRVSREEEMQGLDVMEHGGSGYGIDTVPTL